MTRQVECSRCKRTAPGPERIFLPSPLLETVQERVCGDCWDAWRAEQTKIINELRLDLSQQAAQETVHTRMRTFLNLPEGS